MFWFVLLNCPVFELIYIILWNTYIKCQNIFLIFLTVVYFLLQSFATTIIYKKKKIVFMIVAIVYYSLYNKLYKINVIRWVVLLIFYAHEPRWSITHVLGL